jgi:alpha-tubulin suppressor-like RCC1 family protein
MSRGLSTTSKRCQNDPESDARRNRPLNSSYHHKKDAATAAEMKSYEKSEGWKGVLTGLFAISGILGAFAIYQNQQSIYSFIFNRVSPNDDAILGRVKDLEKRKRRNKNFSELPVVTNDHDSSVPGVYLWGDNSNLVVNPDVKVKEVRFPTRYDWFDGKSLSKLRVFEKSALAIDTKGDLIQWGQGFFESGDGSESIAAAATTTSTTTPEYSIRGESLVDAKISNGVIYCLNNKNEILIIPESKRDQHSLNHSGTSRRGWGRFWARGGSTSFSKVATADHFEKGERIIDYQTGCKHLLVLTNLGKVYSSSTGLKSTPLGKSHGQLGLIEYNQFQNLPNSNELHNVELLNNEVNTKTHKVITRFITQIAAGSNHSIALDSNGEVYSFGENFFGQLGHDINGYDNEIVSFPKKMDLMKHGLVKRDYFPKVTEIKASGDSTFATIEPVRMFHVVKNKSLNENTLSGIMEEDEDAEKLYIGFGSNLKGQLGCSKFIHSQHRPSKITALSDFKDYNESTNCLELIKPVKWSFDTDHSFMVLENRDVLHWGGNDHGELGNGKKSRIAKPCVMPALIEPGYTLEQVNDMSFVNRLRLKENQEIVAGVSAGAIYYKS